MRYGLLDMLACPSDHHYPLSVAEKEIFDEESIQRGALQCEKCGRLFPIVDGIPCFLPEELREPGLTESANREVQLKTHEIEYRNREAEIHHLQYGLYRNRLELESFLKRLEIMPGDLVLDAGCGNGRVTLEIAKLEGIEILAVDFAFGFVRALQDRLGAWANSTVHLINADLNYLPFRDGVCNSVFSHQVLQHIPNLTNNPLAFQEIRRVMTESGRFLMTVYNYSELRGKVANWLPNLTYENCQKEGYHINSGIYYYRFTSDELESVLGSYFEIEELTGLCNIPKKIAVGIEKLHIAELGIKLDQTMEKFRLSRSTGSLLLAKCFKTP